MRTHAENKDIFSADLIMNLDVRTVHGADGQRAVQRHLHVAGAGSFGSRRGNLLG